jgi:hypothetical protein
MKSSQYESDHVILEDDPYFEEDCERRMIFISDLVPEQDRYKLYDASTERPEYLNAVDKFFNWCESRPTSARRGRSDWNEEGYNDGRKARHFLLKMGPLEGLYGNPTTLAARLKSTWSHLLIKRVRSSHVTIETEIPLHMLTGTDYFNAYMDQIVDLTSPTKLGNRLTVKLCAGPTDALCNADPKFFYSKEIDVEREWLLKIKTADEKRRFVLSLVDPHNLDRQITSEDISKAEHIFKTSRWEQNEREQSFVDTAIVRVKQFIQAIHKFEQSKHLAIAHAVPNTFPIETYINSTVPTNTTRYDDLGTAKAYSATDSNTRVLGAPSHALGALEEQPVAASQSFVPLPHTAANASFDSPQQPLPSRAGS